LGIRFIGAVKNKPTKAHEDFAHPDQSAAFGFIAKKKGW